ncbi:hypothetical protein QQZ08_006882 [Neonectria magnoliae]|uniref:Uncharacterized protein n=1 Tax=Neonectria magnoliae TaxID=2732573 RepID=A0ABR1HZB8_9HYPO
MATSSIQVEHSDVASLKLSNEPVSLDNAFDILTKAVSIPMILYLRSTEDPINAALCDPLRTAAILSDYHVRFYNMLLRLYTESIDGCPTNFIGIGSQFADA